MYPENTSTVYQPFSCIKTVWNYNFGNCKLPRFSIYFAALFRKCESISLSRYRISGQFYQENGEKVDKDLVEKVWELYLNMETKMEETYTKRDKTQPVSNHTSIAQYVQKARPQILQQFPEGARRTQAANVLNTLLNYCQFINGEELDQLSADLCGQYKSFSGAEMMFAGNGYSGFVEQLLKKIPEDVIHREAEVIKICWATEGQAEVVCKNGKRYTADHVVVTCSLGHLKANYKQMFDPQLPESKAGAIERTGFGRVTKLFLYYDEPFWADGVKLAWSQHGQSITETSDWVRSIEGFQKLPFNSKIIGGPFGGGGAEIVESLTDDEVSAACRDLLRKFLKVPSIPKPTMVLRSKWNSDPLYRGAYSYLSTKNRENDILDLAAPLPGSHRPMLLFAGEATHPCYYSTVHGAYLSGMRESQRLTELYEK